MREKNMTFTKAADLRPVGMSCFFRSRLIADKLLREHFAAGAAVHDPDADLGE